MISVEEADRIVADAVAPLPDETVAVASAYGRVLREPIRAERDQPPFDRVMMDGIALATSGPGRSRRMVGTAPAGQPAATLADASDCIEVMTGAPLPSGCDCVVPVELIARDGDRVAIAAEATLEPGTYVHPRGADHLEDAVLAESGRRLDGPLLALAATAGCAELAVARRPKVAVVTTGDELIAPGDAIEAHQIRRSNDLGMAGLIAAHTGARTARHHAEDTLAGQRELFERLLADSDVLVISGGVSKGSRDYVAEALTAAGVTAHFHRVRQRPGKPMWFGTGPAGQCVFGLPGNPVAATVGARRYVVPALLRMQGLAVAPAPVAELAEPFVFEPALNYFLPCRLQFDGARLRAWPGAPGNSGDLTTLAASDGFLELPAAESRFEAGAHFPWYGWS